MSRNYRIPPLPGKSQRGTVSCVYSDETKEKIMKRLVVSLIIGVSLVACTGGDMGNTRGGGAAPGQSGGRDTGTGSAGTTAAPAAGAAVPGNAATPAATVDTTKRTGTKGTKRP